MSRLLKELQSVFDANEISNMLSEEVADDDSLATSDSDLDDTVSDESEDEMQSDTRAASSKAVIKEDINSGGTSNPSLSDEGKEEDASFRDEYSSLLDSELKSSSLAKSFAKGKEVALNDNTKALESDREQAEPNSIPMPSAGAAEDGGQDEVDENEVVDVDVNLVESLLRSYMLQQGMPGPASNLLGAMGMELPDNSDQRPEPREKHK